jgi:hypothetical protein
VLKFSAVILKISVACIHASLSTLIDDVVLCGRQWDLPKVKTIQNRV